MIASTALIYLSVAVFLYLLIAVLPFYLLCVVKPKFLIPWQSREIKTDWQQIKLELTRTVYAFIVMYLYFYIYAFLKNSGHLKIYTSLSEWPLTYTILSLAIIVILHDTYFYWTHRLMHKVSWLKRIHFHHHQSHHPTSLSVYSFHPIESMVQFAFFLLYPILIPVYEPLMIYLYIFSLLSNSAGHLPYEFYPSFLYKYPIFKESNSALHHNMHHQNGSSNFGLYYNFWDRWCNTNNSDYFESYEQQKLKTRNQLKI